jgi:hypothetical protein
VDKGRLKERCGLEPRTNFFPFKKSPKTECGLDLGAHLIQELTVYGDVYLIMSQSITDDM